MVTHCDHVEFLNLRRGSSAIAAAQQCLAATQFLLTHLYLHFMDPAWPCFALACTFVICSSSRRSGWRGWGGTASLSRHWRSLHKTFRPLTQRQVHLHISNSRKCQKGHLLAHDFGVINITANRLAHFKLTKSAKRAFACAVVLGR